MHISDRAEQLRNIPAPQLVGPAGQQLGGSIGGVSKLIPPLSHFSVLGQEAIHCAFGTEIRALVEQGGVDLGGGQVHEAGLVQPLRGQLGVVQALFHSRLPSLRESSNRHPGNLAGRSSVGQSRPGCNLIGLGRSVINSPLRRGPQPPCPDAAGTRPRGTAGRAGSRRGTIGARCAGPPRHHRRCRPSARARRRRSPGA
jgi:hypothetical protein